jgi:virulence factor Mce-like protein
VRTRRQPAFANPVLIGAVTVLVAVVAVFLAYNATNGLPFVPTRQLKVEFTNGAALVVGNDVREGGYRVGVVASMKPVLLPNGQVGAEAVLNLNTSQGKIPVDSTATIRPRSALGLKYVDIARGHSTKVFPDGGVVKVAHTTVPVQFDDINTLFDARTRPAVERNLAGYGDALAARGSSLNDTISTLPSLFGHLQPVAQYLSDPNTELTRFFEALNGFMGTVSPVAATNVRLFADQATTFEAISRNASDLANSIKESPPTLDVSTRSLIAQQPLLADLTTLNRQLLPATEQLKQALPNINPALAAGIRVLPRTPPVNQKLENVLGSLRSLSLDPGTNEALNGLNQTVTTLNPMIKYLGPYVTVCNQFNYFWGEIQDLVSEQTSFGMAQRALIQFNNHQASNAGVQGSAYPANGYQPGDPPDTGYPGDAEYAHGPAYAAAVNNQGTADCEVGQRGYQVQQNQADPRNRSIVSDAHTPGTQGTTWTGLSRVPPGETFSRNPTVGPQLPYYPANP